MERLDELRSYLTGEKNGGFPNVVNISAVTPTNKGGGVHFDSTPAVFDTILPHEYLTSTGQQGGPLVTTQNVTTRSDLRLYESDGNATMKDLAALGEGLLGKCEELLGRMINTVPSSVVLSDPVEILTVQPLNASLDLNENGEVLFVGSIRVCLQPFNHSKLLHAEED
jgi:hypothetical protein